MQYILLFLEGVIAFISPCLLPLLPVYISYFAGMKGRPIINSVGFVAGFTTVFVALGAFAGMIGGFLLEYRTAINIVTGLFVIVLGLNYLGVLRLSFSTANVGERMYNKVWKAGKPLTFTSSILFGMVFSIAWTPCVSTFLGAALLRASQQGSMLDGMFMLFVFSMGLGIPFVVSAVLIDRLKSTFDFIKKNYCVINILAGSLLVLVGILMMTGIFW